MSERKEEKKEGGSETMSLGDAEHGSSSTAASASLIGWLE